MRVTVGDVVLECVKGDITRQPDIDAIVNAANAWLTTGAGVAGAIHTAAGPELEEECRSLAPIKPGQAVITGAHRLPNRHVIHCLGPRYGVDVPSDRLLADCYQNALSLAEAHQLGSVAFPAISTGVFGYPRAEAAEIAIGTVVRIAPSLQHVRLVRFVLWDEAALDLYQEVFDRVLRQ